MVRMGKNWRAKRANERETKGLGEQGDRGGRGSVPRFVRTIGFFFHARLEALRRQSSTPCPFWFIDYLIEISSSSNLRVALLCDTSISLLAFHHNCQRTKKQEKKIKMFIVIWHRNRFSWQQTKCTIYPLIISIVFHRLRGKRNSEKLQLRAGLFKVR